MKLYYAPWACSLADHIALLEAGFEFDLEAVDLRTKRTASGSDFLQVNPRGFVPALVVDDGQVLTENIAILDWISGQAPSLQPGGVLGRARQLEMLSFIESDVHHAYKPMWHPSSDAEKRKAAETVAGHLRFAASRMQGDYLFGDQLSAADCFLFVMLRWAERFDVAVPDTLLRLQWRMAQRPSVKDAIRREEGKAPAVHARLDARVKENPGEHRFERAIHGTAFAAAYYRDADGKLAFVHTEVPSEFSGQGIGTELARGTFDLLREQGRRAVLICPFMTNFYAKHPEYADVVEA
jgi:glutathione S-transferase